MKTGSIKEEEANSDILACEKSYFAHVGRKPFLKFSKIDENDEEDSDFDDVYPQNFTFTAI